MDQNIFRLKPQANEFHVFQWTGGHMDLPNVEFYEPGQWLDVEWAIDTEACKGKLACPIYANDYIVYQIGEDYPDVYPEKDFLEAFVSTDAPSDGDSCPYGTAECFCQD
jgi:hypothetical protein